MRYVQGEEELEVNHYPKPLTATAALRKLARGEPLEMSAPGIASPSSPAGGLAAALAAVAGGAPASVAAALAMVLSGEPIGVLATGLPIPIFIPSLGGSSTAGIL